MTLVFVEVFFLLLDPDVACESDVSLVLFDEERDFEEDELLSFDRPLEDDEVFASFEELLCLSSFVLSEEVLLLFDKLADDPDLLRDASFVSDLPLEDVFVSARTLDEESFV